MIRLILGIFHFFPFKKEKKKKVEQSLSGLPVVSKIDHRFWYLDWNTTDLGLNDIFKSNFLDDIF